MAKSDMILFFDIYTFGLIELIPYMAMKTKITKIRRGCDKHSTTYLDTERWCLEGYLSNNSDLFLH